MTPRRLAVVAVLALVALVWALWSLRPDGPAESVRDQGLLLPQFDAQGVVAIRVQDGTGALRAHWALEEGRWLDRTHDGWPAQSGRIREWLGGLGQVRLLEAKTARAENHGILGVADPGPSGGPGWQVELLDASDSVLATLRLGLPNPHGTGLFARHVGETQAWLVDGRVGLPDDPRQWLDREVLDVPAIALSALRIDGEDVTGLEHAMTLLEGLRLHDVRRGAPAADDALEGRITVEALTIDGLAVDMLTWLDVGRRWASVSVRFDAEAAEAAMEEAVARDRHALEQAGSELTPEAVGMEPLDVAGRVEERRVQAQRMAQRLQGWSFGLTPGKQAIIEAPRDPAPGP